MRFSQDLGLTLKTRSIHKRYSKASCQACSTSLMASSRPNWKTSSMLKTVCSWGCVCRSSQISLVQCCSDIRAPLRLLIFSSPSFVFHLRLPDHRRFRNLRSAYLRRSLLVLAMTCSCTWVQDESTLQMTLPVETCQTLDSRHQLPTRLKQVVLHIPSKPP